jgi:hypothetical protein
MCSMVLIINNLMIEFFFAYTLLVLRLACFLGHTLKVACYGCHIRQNRIHENPQISRRSSAHNKSFQSHSEARLAFTSMRWHTEHFALLVAERHFSLC